MHITEKNQKAKKTSTEGHVELKAYSLVGNTVTKVR